MAARSDSQEVFDNLSTKFANLLYGRKEGDRVLVNKILDDLNGLDYRCTIVTNSTKAVLLVNNCCNLVPTDESVSVAKCCRLITSLINRQYVTIEGRTLTLVVTWCLQSLKQSPCAEVLVALEALIRSNTHNLPLFVNDVLAANSPIVGFAQNCDSPEFTLLAVECLEACTCVCAGEKKQYDHKYAQFLNFCSKVFVTYLVSERTDGFDALMHTKLLISCLKGVQNVTQHNSQYLEDELGLLLGVVKTYMVYGIRGVDFIVPTRIMPSALGIPEPSTAVPREKKGGKITRQRKHRLSGGHNKKENKKSDDWDEPQGYIPASFSLEVVSSDVTTSALQGRLKTSDSDFSDTEGGKVAKLSVIEGRLRQTALQFLLSISKIVDKSTLFSFWSSFIPDSSTAGTHYLTTCILKDTSPKGRLAALNSLLVFLTTSKLYLAQAEMSAKTASFTPFSIALGYTIRELHRCLCLALNENSLPVLTQVLKCLAALVQATPYKRLEPGLVSKVVRNVKVYVNHRDTTVQVAALIVIGCLLASEPPVAETRDAFLKSLVQQNVDDHKDERLRFDSDEFDYAEFSSEDDEEITTDVAHGDVPWLLSLCLRNLGLKNEQNCVDVPAPVKLESLQVLSAFCRNYFAVLVAPYIGLVTKALDHALVDKYADLRLHAGRAVDFIGQAMNGHFERAESSMTLESGVVFWQTLLNGALISLLQDEEHAALRAVGCDCLGSIGAHVFERLQTDKRILIVTLLFGCSRDGKPSVKGAAIRALGICVLYPSLNEDTGFVLDTAEAIHRILQDENTTVKIKASWSLGNLSDALLLNRRNANTPDDIPESVIVKMLHAGVRSASDNDKIKMNSVRALGNLLQLLTPQMVQKRAVFVVAEEAVNGLVRAASSGPNMKVRWNACYALANVLKSDVLFENGRNFQAKIFPVLTELVVGFRNFKVRINAALALASPTLRSLYGEFYVPVWAAMLKALDNSQNMEDFNEYKHRDNLVDQICLSLGHLTTLLTEEDLQSVQDVVLFYSDSLKTHMRRVLERLVPEKAGVLVSAYAHVNVLLSRADSAGGKCEVLRLLADVFNAG